MYNHNAQSMQEALKMSNKEWDVIHKLAQSTIAIVLDCANDTRSRSVEELEKMYSNMSSKVVAATIELIVISMHAVVLESRVSSLMEKVKEGVMQ